MRLPLRDLERAVAEQAELRGAFVDNVYQCGPRTFLLRLKPAKVHLLLDLEPGRARVLVTDDPPPVPEKPPVFGTILRKALRGGRLLGTVLLGEDRIVAVDVEVAGALRRVVVEAFARHGNLLLLDAEGTVERVLDGDAARHRGNPVGARYALPPAPRIPEEESLVPADLPARPFAANLALDRLFRAEAGAREHAAEERDQEKVLARIARARAAAEKDLRELPDPGALRAQGELLLAHYGELRQGMKAYQGVALDPRLAPQENVDRVFQLARKAERARPALEERLRELDDLAERARTGGTVPAALLSRKGRPPEPRRPYRVFQSADGRRILVGKGGRDNDETTLKVAGPHDVFLHVRGTPGAHVIVPLARDEPVPEQTLLDAATLAVHYSKMRTAKAADVAWCLRKYVSKPRGAKPGLVQVQREKVLRLRREPERLARLLMGAE